MSWGIYHAYKRVEKVAEIHGLLNNKKVEKLKQREERKRILRKAEDYIVYSSTE